MHEKHDGAPKILRRVCVEHVLPPTRKNDTLTIAHFAVFRDSCRYKINTISIKYTREFVVVLDCCECYSK